MKAVLSNRIYLSSTPELFKRCREALYYVIPPKNSKFGRPEIVNDIVMISPTVFSIPIGRQELIPEDYEIIDKRTSVGASIPKPLIELREDQVSIFDAVNDNCLINAKPGYGKTFTGLHIAKKLGLKTLVVVHNTALRDQWEEETYKLFGFRPDIIGTGKLNSSTSIVISNTQTLVKHLDKFSKEFGTLIVDEVHRTPSTIFKKIVDSSYARYKIGLSATIKRKDNKHVFIPDYFSKDIFIPDTDTALIPTITIIRTKLRLSVGKVSKVGKLSRKTSGGWASQLTELCDNPEYIELVSNLVDIKSNVEGHKVLCIGDRLNFLDVCTKRVANSVKVTSETTNRKEIHEGFYDIPTKYNSLFGITSIYKEGISVNPLSCLVLGAPINNEPLLEQVIGRVTRPHKGKKNPEIVDIGLDDPVGRRQLATRVNYYINRGYKIREIRLD